MMEDYNLLTRRLLAEGYTAENHPDYVRVASSCFSRDDSLKNLSGGFEFTPKAKWERVYETPCGLQVLGKTVFSMSWYGTMWCHENDNPVFHCPYSYPICGSCKKRPEPFCQSKGNRFCTARLSFRPYHEENSVELADKEQEAHVEQRRQEFLKTHERACPHHLKYDEWKECWEMKYDPGTCITYGNCSFCNVFQEELGTSKGNIYYDIELEGRDYSKDGTFFEGERVRTVHKGYQYFPKPVNLKLAERFLKVNRAQMEGTIKFNVLDRLIGSITSFRASRGEIDLHWEFKNFRVVKKDVRDLEQDLADIAAGIRISHVLDEKKMVKQAKQRRIAKAKEVRAKKMRKLVLSKELDSFERKRAVKLLGADEFNRLIKEKGVVKAPLTEKDASVQLSLFDLLEAEG